MRNTPDRRSGFTLIEMLIAVALLAILAAALLPATQPAVHDQLQAAARQLAADLAYGRSLAVNNASQYRFTFDLTANRYTLSHSGTNTALNTLPATPFRSPLDTATTQVVDLDDLPQLGASVRLDAVQAIGSSTTSVTTVDFATLGETTRSEQTVIWLTAGAGSAQRWIALRVQPTTGLVTIDTFTASGPSSGVGNGVGS